VCLSAVALSHRKLECVGTSVTAAMIRDMINGTVANLQKTCEYEISV
jgi:hypothetical protein